MVTPRRLLVAGLLTVFLVGACAPAPTPTPTATPTKAPTATPRAGTLSPEAEQGKALYTSKGCAGCHGPNGEGTAAGPPLGGHTEEQVKKQVRTPTGTMPAFTPAQISDAELEKIAHFITTLAKPMVQLSVEEKTHLQEVVKALEAKNTASARQHLQLFISIAAAANKAEGQELLAHLDKGELEEVEHDIKDMLK